MSMFKSSYMLKKYELLQRREIFENKHATVIQSDS